MVSVSVVMPVYNGAKTVEESVKSILNQDLADFELIIVDDGSTDATPQLLKKFEFDPRVMVHRKPNGGIVSALNAGISLAQSEYIARADSDDLYAPERLRLQFEFLQRNSAAVLVSTDFVKVYSDGHRVPVRLRGDHEQIVHQLFHANHIMHSSVMFRKKEFLEVGGYLEEWKHIEDWELWFRLAKVGKLANIEKDLSFLSVHAGSVTAKNEIAQARLGFALRLKLIREAVVSSMHIAYLLKPLAKSLMPQAALASYRNIFQKRR